MKIVRVEPEVVTFTLGERPPGWPRTAGPGVEVRALDTELAAHCVQAPGAVVLVGIPARVPGGAQLQAVSLLEEVITRKMTKYKYLNMILATIYLTWTPGFVARLKL